MRSSLLYAVPAVALVLAACSASDPVITPAPEPIAHAASPIINGQNDTTHQAVVAIILQQGNEGGLCSGTIVKVDPVNHIGWVLTAAHCVAIPPVYVLQGNDFAAATGVLRYEVVDYASDARYTQTSSPFDVAVIRIAGVDSSTPTIPIVGSPDGLSVGTPVLAVGYGRTSLIATGPGDDNSVRHRVAKSLGQVSQSIGYDMATEGTCSGDSGGPVLVTSGGTEKIAGLTSYHQGGDCNGVGFAARVQTNLAFITNELAKAVPTEDCGLCEKIANSGNSTCAALSTKCLADKDCKGYYECISKGTAKATCVAQFPKAEGPFNAATNCTCTTACKATCGTTLACRNVPKCGYKLPAGSCSTCTEGACCQEALDCSADGTCYVCLKTKDADPACATNAARKKMATCVASKCNTECADSGLQAGADPVTPEPVTDPNAAAPPTTTTTTTTEGCSVSSTSTTSSGAGYALVGLAAVVTALARRRRASL